MNNPLHQEIAKLRRQLDERDARIAELEREAQHIGMDFIGVADLTPHQSVIVGALVRWGKVSFNRIYTLLAEHGSSGPCPDTVKSHLNRIRTKLGKHNIEIKRMTGVGVEMPAASRDRMRSLAGLPVVQSPSIVPEVV